MELGSTGVEESITVDGNTTTPKGDAHHTEVDSKQTLA